MTYILNDSQQKIHDEAVYWFNNSSEQLFQIAGPAGTGKSVLISQILDTLRLSSNHVLACAYTGAASLVMRKRGFPKAQTIHSALYNLVEYPDYNNIDLNIGVPKKKKVFELISALSPDIRLIFIDEAYMVPNRMVKDILSFGVKVIVAGDTQQLDPIGDDPGFLVSGNIHRLTQLMRQAETDPIVYLAQRAIQGLPIHNGVYGNVLVANDNDFLPQMIGFADVILCATNRTRELFNNQVRYLANYNSPLPRIGERVICRQNNWNEFNGDGFNLVNGLAGTVISQYETLDPADKSVFQLDFLPDNAVYPFLNLRANFEYFSSDFQHKKEMKDISGENFYKGDFFEYAYALSVHLSQGSEYNNVLYVEEFIRPQMQNKLNYTAITRAKKGLVYIKKTSKYIRIQND